MSVVQMKGDQLQCFIETVCLAVTEDKKTSEAASTIRHTPQPKKSFGNCRFSFEGKRDTRYVEEFITSIELYKKVEQISDEDAFRGISLLFYGLAATWWQGVKREAKTWNNAIELIRIHFSPNKPAHQIYMEIFQSNQDGDTDIDTFVYQKRALLAQLPDEVRPNEETEIDFIYGMLHVKYSKRIARQDVKTYRDLLEKGRAVEDIINELTDPCAKCHFSGHTVQNCKKIYSDENDSDIFVIYT